MPGGRGTQNKIYRCGRGQSTNNTRHASGDENALMFLERLQLEAETCKLDKVEKHKIMTLVLLNRLSDDKTRRKLLKDKELERCQCTAKEVQEKIQEIESQKREMGVFTTNIQTPNIATTVSQQETLMTNYQWQKTQRNTNQTG